MSEIMEKLVRYRQLRDEIDARTAELSTVKAELADVEKEAIEIMELDELKSVALDDGSRITRVDKKYPSITDRPAAYDWLKEMGVYEDMATINTNTFKAFINRRLEDGEPIPSCVHLEYISSLQLRR